VNVDPVQIEHALFNLLDNGLKFSPPGASLSIEVVKAPGEVLVRIHDNGPGIADSDLERIFEPFCRAAGARDREGTGLGLAIARGFLETNGGRVWAQRDEGRGACFVVALPAALPTSRRRTPVEA
jgi:two-component system sensor histidine kinase KdpD